MNTFWRTPFGFVLAVAALCSVAKADPSAADTSLDREVDYYLENNRGAGADADGVQFKFSKGFQGESGDGSAKIEIGGRAMYDMTFADSDEGLEPSIGENDLGFRRARFHMAGHIYTTTLFKVEIDFANGEVELRDVYIGLNKVGPGKFLIGHMKEPFSLNELTSSKYIAFTERAASTQAFAPSHNTGFAWFGNFTESKRLYLAGGSFFNTSSVQGAGSGQGGWGLVGRVGYLAIQNEDKDMILWVGFDARWSDYRISDRGPQEVRYRARPQSFGDRFINTGDIAAESDVRFCFEIAFAIRSFHAQAEFFMADVSRAPGAGEDPTFTGFYVQGGWFITGESRNFKTSGSWDRVKPKTNFWTGDGGKGALEVAVRFDSTDLTDAGIEGGEMDSITVGFNWYWNPNTRMMVNYVMADITGSNAEGIGDGELSIVILRWQIDF